MSQLRTVAIHYHRPGKPMTIFNEGFVSDDGISLRTYTLIPGEIAERLTHSLQHDGLIEEQQHIVAVR